MDTIYQLRVDAGGIVAAIATSNLLQTEYVEVSQEMFSEASSLGIGKCRWAEGALLPHETADPAPSVTLVISDRQFAQALADAGTITQDEALAWAARGDLPATMDGAVNALPDEHRFAARMLLAAATSYERSHPLVGVLAGLLGYDEVALDELWRTAAAL